MRMLSHLPDFEMNQFLPLAEFDSLCDPEVLEHGTRRPAGDRYEWSGDTYGRRILRTLSRPGNRPWVIGY